MLGKRKKKVVENILNDTDADEIFLLLYKDEVSETEVFTVHGYDTWKRDEVLKEAGKLEKDINKELKKAVDEAEIISAVSSDLLTVSVVVEYVKKWCDGNPDEDKTFEEWKATLETEGD